MRSLAICFREVSLFHAISMLCAASCQNYGIAFEPVFATSEPAFIATKRLVPMVVSDVSKLREAVPFPSRRLFESAVTRSLEYGPGKQAD